MTLSWTTVILIELAISLSAFLFGYSYAKKSIEFHTPNVVYDHCYHGQEEL